MHFLLAYRHFYHPYVTLMLVPAKLDGIKGIFEDKCLWLFLWFESYVQSNLLRQNFEKYASLRTLPSTGTLLPAGAFPASGRSKGEVLGCASQGCSAEVKAQWAVGCVSPRHFFWELEETCQLLSKIGFMWVVTDLWFWSKPGHFMVLSPVQIDFSTLQLCSKQSAPRQSPTDANLEVLFVLIRGDKTFFSTDFWMFFWKSVSFNAS